MTEEQIISGAIPDKIDTRDYKYSNTPIGMSSSPFNWALGYDIEATLGHSIKPKDQNGSYSCGGNAISMYGAIKEEYNNQDIGERSAKFSYSQCYQNGGGSSMRDLIILSQKQGFGLESMCPSYENGLPPSEKFMTRSEDITDACRKDAIRDTVFTYANVAIDIDSFAQAIRDNQGMVFGVTGQNGKGWLTAYPQPPEKDEWHHWLYAGKAIMRDGKKYIGVLNSWGDTIGQNGWQWISEDYFTAKVDGYPSIWNTWTIVVNKNNNGLVRKLMITLIERLLKGLK
jgi:hypothetical protein